MWTIQSITVPSGYGAATIYGGLGASPQPQNVGTVFGPQGAVYFFSVAGLGSFFLTDVGSVNGNWSVQLNGGTTLWYPGGGGSGTPLGNIVINADGTFTINGGLGSVSGTLVANMEDTGLLTQAMVTMVMGSAALQQSWANNAMNTLYMMGYPTTCMMNMEQACCIQFMALLQSFPISQVLTVEEMAQLRNGDSVNSANWTFQCMFCRVGVAGIVAALAYECYVAISAAASSARAVAALSMIPRVSALAQRINQSVTRTAWLIFGSGAAIGEFVSAVTEACCESLGQCNAAHETEGSTLAENPSDAHS